MANLTICIRSGNTLHEPGYLLTFNYDANLVEELKAAIPHTARAWHPVFKTWWVSIDYENVLERLFGNFHALVYQQMNMPMEGI